MKKIKELNVEITFNVGLCDIEVSDKVYNQLVHAGDYGLSINCDTSKFSDACDFLSDNVSLSDALDCEYEVEVITEEED